jgi:hypothetical protein
MKMKKAPNIECGQRNSSIELFRIITMICIVAHHYVVNSGILQEITQANVLSFNSIFALLFGGGGKTGINCFVLITGYFMCKSNISVKKFLKLVLEIEFYNILFYLIFLLSGYLAFDWKEAIKTIVPIYHIGTSFTSSYLAFYLFIPFLNLLINAMNELEHRKLICCCLLVECVLQSFLLTPNAFTYIGWFVVLYFIASYIRLYPIPLFDNTKRWALVTFVMLLLSWLSIIVGAVVYQKTGKILYYFFVADSNKILAVSTSVSAFLFFRNLKLKYIPVINTVAASTFGVLMIHANSDAMRQWLWGDLLNNVSAYHSGSLVVHAVLSVLAVYTFCTVVDMVRIKVLEKPFFRWYDLKLDNVFCKNNNQE